MRTRKTSHVYDDLAKLLASGTVQAVVHDLGHDKQAHLMLQVE